MLDESKYYRGNGAGWKRGPMIGHGGSGRVYLATTMEWVDCLPPRMAVKSTTCKLTHLQEKIAITDIGPCPFIVNFHGSDKTTSCRFHTRCYDLLFEYASVGTVADLIRKSNYKGLPESDVRRYTRDVLQGLHHIHQRGYVHCDIKPDNILLFGEDASSLVAKIGDLGLAKRANTKQDKWGGTEGYLASETVLNNEQEPSSDIWAIGCTVMAMLTGKLHLDGDDERRISSEGLEFMEACMKMRPEDRLTTEMLLKHPFVSKEQQYDTKKMILPIKKRKLAVPEMLLPIKKRKLPEVIDVENGINTIY